MQGLQNLGLTVTYSPGCNGVACSSIAGFNEAIKLVESHTNNAIIAVIGLDQSQER